MLPSPGSSRPHTRIVRYPRLSSSRVSVIAWIAGPPTFRRAMMRTIGMSWCALTSGRGPMLELGRARCPVRRRTHRRSCWRSISGDFARAPARRVEDGDRSQTNYEGSASDPLQRRPSKLLCSDRHARQEELNRGEAHTNPPCSPQPREHPVGEVIPTTSRQRHPAPSPRDADQARVKDRQTSEHRGGRRLVSPRSSCCAVSIASPATRNPIDMLPPSPRKIFDGRARL